MSNLLLTLLLDVPLAPHAYIDPSTGGMLFQLLALLLAVGSGILFFFSRQIKSVIARLRRARREDDGQQPPDESA